MTRAIGAGVLTVVCLGWADGGFGADVGRGFGSEFSVLATARQAGTGGLALEDPWRQGNFVEATSVVLSSGVRWLEFGAQGGAGAGLRIGADGFAFTPTGIAGTSENADGTYAGETGDVKASSWGAHLVGQWTVADGGVWRAAVVGRATGVVQQLSVAQSVGVGADAGVQAQRATGKGEAMTFWCLAGPLGWGADRLFAASVTAGAGWMSRFTGGLFCASEGCALGAEGELLSDKLVHGGAGAVYWFGAPSAAGCTLSLRAGVREASGSAQVTQPRAGIGMLWRSPRGWGLQFDYAIVPLGELGYLHYATLAVRIAPPVEE